MNVCEDCFTCVPVVGLQQASCLRSEVIIVALLDDNGRHILEFIKQDPRMNEPSYRDGFLLGHRLGMMTIAMRMEFLIENTIGNTIENTVASADIQNYGNEMVEEMHREFPPFVVASDDDSGIDHPVSP